MNFDHELLLHIFPGYLELSVTKPLLCSLLLMLLIPLGVKLISDTSHITVPRFGRSEFI